MPTDHIRYDLLAQDALRGLVRKVLTDTAAKGLPGDHHFYISFDTGSPGVRLSTRMREQYPEEMTIVLQHQFWDLRVGEDAFEVGLSFGGIAERLNVPFAAITGFADPSVQFALQFQTVAADGAVDQVDGKAAGARLAERIRAERKPSAPQTTARPQPRGSVPSTRKPAAAPASQTPPASPDGKPDPETPETDKPAAEVVMLDRFRKK